MPRKRKTPQSSVGGASAPSSSQMRVSSGQGVSRNARRRRRNRQRQLAIPADRVGKYRGILENPFTQSHERLGMGNLLPSSLLTTWARTSWTESGMTPVKTAFTLLFCPSVITRSVAVGNNSFWTLYTGTAAGEGMGLATWDAAGSQNYPTINNLATEARVVSAGLRFRIRYPMTAIPGQIFIVPVGRETPGRINVLSYTAVSQLLAAKEVNVNSGSCSVEVQYRPQDALDFEFGPISNTFQSNIDTTAVHTLAIVGVGWPAGGFSMSWDLISNFEGRSTMQGAGMDIAGAPDLDLSTSDVSRAVRTLPAYRHISDDDMLALNNRQSFFGAQGLRGLGASPSVSSSSDFVTL